MNNISMNQALSIWSELWQAYYGDSGYGGDTAEIYAYRLMPYSPTFNMTGETFQESNDELRINAVKLAHYMIKRGARMHIYCDCKSCVNNGWTMVSGYACRIRKQSIRIDKSGKCTDKVIDPNYKPLFKGDK